MDSRLINIFKTRFVRGGRNIETGMDCQGVFLEVMRIFGHDVNDNDTAVYATETIAKLIENEAKYGKWELLDKPEPGCLVVMGLDPEMPEKAQHLGVYIGKGKFIHILERKGVITTDIEHRFFKNKIRGFYRWTG